MLTWVIVKARIDSSLNIWELAKLGAPPLLVPSFFTRFFRYATSLEKVVFFWTPEEFAVQNPHFFRMSWHGQFLMAIASVSTWGVYSLFLTHIYVTWQNWAPPLPRPFIFYSIFSIRHFIGKSGVFLNARRISYTKTTFFSDKTSCTVSGKKFKRKFVLDEF